MKQSGKAVLLLELENNLPYNPGDHLGVFPKNRPQLVDKIIQRLNGVTDPDAPVQIQVLEEIRTPNGKYNLRSLR
ncbi:hypothetical protein NQ314_002423 [Rhamnusium bicolor]|uniref:nitric-oxide synthase (NADPH) n=1 Tax=Rhamnusium bicolor TaxID=1586634 RepID=A0AAV8ZQ23_9CUCU|nr:hypothetical protein NQ314_002423 [Rhamnusium bicolor]